MRATTFTSSLIGALTVTHVAAFPSRLRDFELSSEHLDIINRAIEQVAGDYENPEALQTRQLGFDPSTQLVSVDGDYAYVPPNFAAGDIRGPCPGLNAMANHGYIPHNGRATIPQFIAGTNKAFGMGVDLGAFLAVYGAVLNGNGAAWSIGGPAQLPGGGLALLGTPKGLTGSHNNYESDVSPTRGDLYQYGNNELLQLSQFKDLYTQPLGLSGYDLDTLTTFRVKRFQQSIANNPNFFNAPFAGVVVQAAAYTFIYRFMSNKSAEYPAGYLNAEVLKSFFSITGDTPDTFVYTPGHEQFPRNWYKRAIGDEYTIPFFATDALAAGVQHPILASIGGNTGKVNTFTGINPVDLTGGVFNTATLFQGNNLACYGFQVGQAVTPDLLRGLLGSVTSGLSQILPAFKKVTDALGCPQLTAVDEALFGPYPGATGTA